MSDLPALPPGWTWATLGGLAESVRNGVFVSRPATSPPGMRILRISSVRPNALDHEDVRYASPEPARAEEYVVEQGDLLFTRYSGNPAYVGVCAVVGPMPAPTLHPDKLIRVVVDKRLVNPRFVQYAVNGGFSRRQVERRLKTTAGQVGVAGSQLRTVPIPVAPRREQERILAAIDEYLPRLDAAEAAVESATRRLQNLDRSIFARAQAEGDEVALGDLLLDIEAGRSFKTPGRRAALDEWGVIKVSAMTWGDFNENENKAVPADHVVNPRHEIRPGDLLLSRANTSEYVGATVLVGVCRPRLLLSDKSMRLRPQEGVDRQWLRFALSAPPVRSQMSLLATGTSDSMRNISQDKVRALRIRVPSLHHQRAIASEIDTALRLRDRLETDLSTATARAASLRYAIFATAFSGQLVPQHLADEPASVLLDRICAERAAGPPTKRTRKAKTP